MKVFLISNLYYPDFYGGAEKVARTVAEGLAERGHEVTVGTLKQGGDLETKQVNGVRVHYVPIHNLYLPGKPDSSRKTASKLLWHSLDSYNPLMVAPLRDLLEMEKPDVVNTHTVGGFSVSAWRTIKKQRLPLVHTTHGVEILCPWLMMSGERVCSKLCAQCWLYSRPRLFLSGEVDVLIGVSQHLVDRFTKQGAFQNAQKTVVYNGYEPPADVPVPAETRNDRIRFGFLGRIDPAKGIRLLLRSFPDIPASKAELVIAGRGSEEYEREVACLASRNAAVRWIWFTSPQKLLSQIDVLVVPSLVHDSAPLVVLESMAHGIPVIGAQRGGIPELMGEGTGWLFDPDRPDALKEELMRAIDSRSELAEMGQRARQRAARFSTQAMLNGYLRAYSRAIELNGQHANAA